MTPLPTITFTVRLNDNQATTFLPTLYGASNVVASDGDSFTLYGVQAMDVKSLVDDGTLPLEYVVHTPEVLAERLGYVLLDFGGTDEVATDLAVQADGKIVVVGWTGDGATYQAGIARLEADGSLDDTFLKQTVTLGTDDDEFTAVAVGPDGKIVAAGFTLTDNSRYDFLVSRFLWDGGLDPTFGTNGSQVTSFGVDALSTWSLVVQDDGKIVAGGRAGGNWALVRYGLDGSLDDTFGTDGVVTTDFGGSDDRMYYLLADGGRFVGAGYTNAGGSYQFALARYNADGSLDDTFGTDGKTVTDVTGNDHCYGVVKLSTGGYLAAGNNEADVVFVGYDADGHLDTSFGSGGSLVVDYGPTAGAYSLALFASDAVVAVGTYNPGTVEFSLTAVKDGALNAAFGGTGKVTHSFLPGTDVGSAVARAAGRNKVLAGGSAGDDMVVARFTERGVLDTTFGSPA